MATFQVEQSANYPSVSLKTIGYKWHTQFLWSTCPSCHTTNSAVELQHGRNIWRCKKQHTDNKNSHQWKHLYCSTHSHSFIRIHRLAWTSPKQLIHCCLNLQVTPSRIANLKNATQSKQSYMFIDISTSNLRFSSGLTSGFKERGSKTMQMWLGSVNSLIPTWWNIPQNYRKMLYRNTDLQSSTSAILQPIYHMNLS